MTDIGMQRMRLQSHAQIRRLIADYRQRLRLISNSPPDRSDCRYRANSAFLLCAVNPNGPCAGCRHYEPRSPH
jgi:hypothetical protein